MLGYNYFKDYYKIMEIGLNKHQGLDAYAKAIQQVNFTGNLKNNETMFFIIVKGKGISDFSQGTGKLL